MVKKLTLEVFQDIARERGGECLSDEYINVNSKLLWECAKGHQWHSTGDNVKNGKTWCPHCCPNNVKLDISVFRDIARSKGGKCLSTEYKNAHTKLLWECKNLHQWSATGDSVRNCKSWCPECYGNVKLDISIFQRIAEERGGKLLSTEYKNTDSKLLWECDKGHEWEATGDHIKNRSQWCSRCSKSRSEQLCREIIEDLTGYEFSSIRPKFLKGLELDGYNAEVYTAFEYQGIQHYQYVPFFHDDESDFKRQQERDQRKYKICQKKGIDLILIPYTLDYRKPDELRTFIRDQLIACGWNA